MKKIIFFIFIFLQKFLPAQNLNAYSDVRNYFYIFDNGKLVEAEYLGVTAPVVGGNSVAYIDNSSNLKIYYDGSSRIESDNKPDKFYESDDLVVYEFNKRLSVFDQGQSTTLCYAHGGYTVGDSIVGFFDTYTSTIKAYKDGTIKEVENLFGKGAPKSMKAGDNILAYVNYNNFLKVFYNGQLFELENYPPGSYQTGNNTLAYIDNTTSNFKLFYKGTTSVLETFAPSSFKVGDDLVAYVDNMGNFKIFYLGDVFQIQSYEPLYYDVVDNVVVYGDKLNFNVFYKRKSTKLESYVPETYQMDFHSIAYKDLHNKIKFFSEGSFKDVSNQIINTYLLTRNVLMYSTDLDMMHFYCNGKNY